MNAEPDLQIDTSTVGSTTDTRVDLGITTAVLVRRPSEEADDLPTFMVTVELAGGGKPRRRVATICRACDRETAEGIALDVNEDGPHAYIVGVRRIAELQIVHPLAWSPRGGLFTNA